MKHTFRTSLAATIASGLLVVCGGALAAPEATDALMSVGEKTYMRECASCHGVEGDGNGNGAYILSVKPRNFQLGVYKFRSTHNGEVPLPEDVYKTITNGIELSMMPAFHGLTEDERWGLTHYVLSLGGLEGEVPEVIEVPPAPERSAARIAQGKDVYARLQCANCHGDDGWGGGPSWTTLEDDAKERVFPTNLTTGRYKGGAGPRDLYLRIASGLDGSPMPSYAAEASSDEIWSLVQYMQSLVRK